MYSAGLNARNGFRRVPWGPMPCSHPYANPVLEFAHELLKSLRLPAFVPCLFPRFLRSAPSAAGYIVGFASIADQGAFVREYLTLAY